MPNYDLGDRYPKTYNLRPRGTQAKQGANTEKKVTDSTVIPARAGKKKQYISTAKVDKASRRTANPKKRAVLKATAKAVGRVGASNQHSPKSGRNHGGRESERELPSPTTTSQGLAGTPHLSEPQDISREVIYSIAAQAAVEAVQPFQEELNTGLAEANAKIDRLMTELAEANTRTDRANTQIAGLTAGLARVQADVSTANARASEAEAIVTILRGDIANIRAEYSDIGGEAAQSSTTPMPAQLNMPAKDPIYPSSQRDAEQIHTLDKVPPEILRYICTFFCTHCTSGPDITRFAYCHLNEGKKELRSLCQASKALRTVAQEVLFHRFSFGSSSINNSPEAFQLYAGPFLRSLCEQPHLRKAVKDLWIKTDTSLLYPGSRPASIVQAQEQITRFIRTLSPEAYMEFFDDQLQPRNLPGAILEMIIAVCPNISAVRIRTLPGWAFDTLVARNDMNPRRPGPPLQILRMVTSRDNTAAICGPTHELCNVPAVGSPAERALITTSAPTLKELKCTLGALRDPPEMPRLEVIKLDVRGTYPDLRALFSKMPKLRQLIYRSSNKHGPLPIEVNTALRDHQRETLEVLAIAFWCTPYNNLITMHPTINNTEFRLGLLSDFRSLKVLVIDAALVWRIRRDEEDQSVEEPFQRITDTIPESLELLCIHSPSRVANPEHIPLLEVADSVRQGRFTALKYLLWTTERYPSNLGYITLERDGWGAAGEHSFEAVDWRTAAYLRKMYPIEAKMP